MKFPAAYSPWRVRLAGRPSFKGQIGRGERSLRCNMPESAPWGALKLKERWRGKTMSFLRSSAKPSASIPMTMQLSPAHGRGRRAALIGVIILLTGGIQLYAQARMASTSLVLQVRPEELLEDKNGTLVLKIRLARGTTARLWMANSCTSPSPESQVITNSGNYNMPLNALRPVSSDSNSSASHVCLVSSDGVLNDSLPVVMIAPINSIGGQAPPHVITQGGASVAMPAGWVVTTRADTTTWSNP